MKVINIIFIIPSASVYYEKLRNTRKYIVNLSNCYVSLLSIYYIFLEGSGVEFFSFRGYMMFQDCDFYFFIFILVSESVAYLHISYKTELLTLHRFVHNILMYQTWIVNLFATLTHYCVNTDLSMVKISLCTHDMVHMKHFMKMFD